MRLKIWIGWFAIEEAQRERHLIAGTEERYRRGRRPRNPAQDPVHHTQDVDFDFRLDETG
jgi:hypothetical protein